MFAREGYILASAVEVHTALLLEIVATPHIVVAGEEVDSNALIGKAGEGAQNTNEALGYDTTILKPEVEYVAHQKYCLSIILDALQPTHEELLGATSLLLITRSKVNIRGEIIHRLEEGLKFLLELLGGELLAKDIALSVK